MNADANGKMLALLAELLDVIGDRPMELKLASGGMLVTLNVIRALPPLDLTLPPGATARRIRIVGDRITADA